MDKYMEIINMIEKEMKKIVEKGSKVSKRCADLKVQSAILEFDREIEDFNLNNLIDILSELKNKKNYLSSNRKKYLIAVIFSIPVCLFCFAIFKLLISGVFTLNIFHILSASVVCSCFGFIKYRLKTKDKRFIYKNYNVKDVEKEISFLTKNKNQIDEMINFLQRLINEEIEEVAQLDKEYENKSSERDKYISRREALILNHLQEDTLVYDELCLDGWIETPEKDADKPNGEMTSDEVAMVPKLKCNS